MKLIVRVMCLVLVLALMVPVAVAQDEVPGVSDALSRMEIISIGLLFIVVVLLVVFSSVVIVALRQANNAAPPWVADLVKDGLLRGMNELQEFVQKTPNTIDDALEAKLREIVLKAIEEADKPASVTRASPEDAAGHPHYG